ncbi:hypothetical protein CYMTET_3562, partial [Cymbomonas tetramitiformis]
VNLLPGDKPADVYTGVADMVRKRVAADAEGLTGKSPKEVEYARTLLPHVDRKLVKQTVMTSVYGVTFVGARQQIQNRLKERGAIPDESLRYMVACYGARSTLQGLNDMFGNARQVMEWLAETANIVAATGDTVRWRTPLGLPVVQPYQKRGKKTVRTLMQNFIITYDDGEHPSVKQKQKSAFPPNYIHSLDSTHMMKTAIDCHAVGLSFAGVHDSFWTHAGTTPEMNRILREKFIEVHDAPLLDMLKEGLEKDYPNLKGGFADPPSLGTLDLQRVVDSAYFFS